MSRLLGYFARGLLVLVPITLTIYILVFVVRTLDDLLTTLLPRLGHTIPGLGVIMTVALTTGVGILFSNVIGRQLYRLLDQLFAHVPLVKLLYTSIRDLVGSFVGGKQNFGQAGSVRIAPGSETRLLGFVTRQDLSALSLPDHVAVYVPQAYNIGGQVLAVHRAQIEPIAASSTELLTFMMSGGASGFMAKRDSAAALRTAPPTPSQTPPPVA